MKQAVHARMTDERGQPEPFDADQQDPVIGAVVQPVGSHGQATTVSSWCRRAAREPGQCGRPREVPKPARCRISGLVCPPGACRQAAPTGLGTPSASRFETLSAEQCRAR